MTKIVFNVGDRVYVCGRSAAGCPITTTTEIEKLYRNTNVKVRGIQEQWRQTGESVSYAGRLVLADSDEGREVAERQKRWQIGRRLEALARWWKRIPSSASRIVVELEKSVEPERVKR